MPLLIGQDGVALGVVVFVPRGDDTIPVGCVVRGKKARTYLLPWRLIRPAGRPAHFTLCVHADELFSYGIEEVDAEVVFDCLPDAPPDSWMN
jgi:hypothetical protein